MNLSHPASEEIEVSRQGGGKRSNKVTFWGSGACLCVSPSARRREGETESDKEQTGREGSREEAGGGAAARGWMLEHRACCVDLIKFTSVLFAVGLVTQLYLCSAVCWGSTTLTQISGRTGARGSGWSFWGQTRCVCLCQGSSSAAEASACPRCAPILSVHHTWEDRLQCGIVDV